MKQNLRSAAASLIALERAELAFGEELHRSLCQTLVGTAFLAEVLIQNAKKGKRNDLADLREIRVALDLAVKDVRFIMLSSILQSEGLLPALSELAARVSLRAPCRFQSKIDHLAIDERKSRVLYRLAKTALALLARGKGGIIVMRLSKLPRNGPYHLTISRRFVSFSAGSLWNKSDLSVMRNCALAVGIKVQLAEPPRAFIALFSSDPRSRTLLNTGKPG